ncbi:MAG: hypothetical protein UHM08_09235 [Bacteroidales bacterium]|jgi:hypothetical protein|nr:hypothetical protein [Bacteroidales bacterium]
MAGLETEVKFFHRIKNPKDAYVSIGWFEDQKYYDGTSIANVAKWNEFGTRQGVPQRPFLRTSIIENEKKWNELLKTLVQRAIDEDKSIDKALLVFGEQVKADIQETILAGGWKPNAKISQVGGWMRNKISGKPFYVKGKGGKQPLIDTGTMLRSIEVRTGEEA